jgi:phage N-6-adenine-methyltransferase
MNAPVFFKSAGDERGTPQDFFDQLNAEFKFDLDAAAGPLNHKCDMYFGEGGLAFNALEEDWGGEGTNVFLNPPYSIAGAFVAKAREEADKGARVVLLLPVRSDTKWWQNHVWDHTAGRTVPFVTGQPDGDWRPGTRVRLLPGRLEFTLVVPDNLRAWIKSEMASAEDQKTHVIALSKVTGLPKMAIERVCQDMPDDCLLEGAPFPSCVVIFEKVK